MEDAFIKTPEEVCTYFKVSPQLGLTEEQVIEQRKKFGRNGKKKYEIDRLEIYTRSKSK